VKIKSFSIFLPSLRIPAEQLPNAPTRPLFSTLSFIIDSQGRIKIKEKTTSFFEQPNTSNPILQIQRIQAKVPNYTPQMPDTLELTRSLITVICIPQYQMCFEFLIKNAQKALQGQKPSG
jgi:hypothetical protein